MEATHVQCSLFPQSIVSVVESFLSDNEADVKPTLEYIITTASLNYVPQDFLCERLVGMLLSSANEEKSAVLSNCLRQIRELHTLHCCKLMWRGVHGTKRDWGFFRDIIKHITTDEDQESQQYQNYLLVFELYISFFEDEHNYRDNEGNTLPVAEHGLYKILGHSGTSARHCKKQILNELFDGMLHISEQTLLLVQRFLNVFCHYYYSHVIVDAAMERQEVHETMFSNFKLLPDDKQQLFLQTFIHQTAKRDFLDFTLRELCTSADVHKQSVEKYRLHAITIDKFINFYYLLKPIQRKKGSLEQFVLLMAHLLQSFLDTAGFQTPQLSTALSSSAGSLPSSSSQPSLSSRSSSQGKKRVSPSLDKEKQSYTLSDLHNSTASFVQRVREISQKNSAKLGAATPQFTALLDCLERVVHFYS